MLPLIEESVTRELEAMNRVAQIVQGLTPDEADRVLGWASRALRTWCELAGKHNAGERVTRGCRQTDGNIG